jgi:hypothetical protein
MRNLHGAVVHVHVRHRIMHFSSNHVRPQGEHRIEDTRARG